MSSYTAPIRDMQFLLHEVLDLQHSGLPGHEDLDADFTGAVLEAAGKLASEVLAPLNSVGDRQGCRLDNGVVRTPDGFVEAFEALKEGGWPGLDCDPAYGGQGLPLLMANAVVEMFAAANMAFVMYPGLTHGAYSAIHTHGTERQKQLYLPKLVSCDWTGTMNLTEPHCGTDLGMLRSKAVPQEDGSYLISGQKIFISAGDHDMAENVIHLVLAKAPGGGEGTRGISLFIVPKFLVNEDGTLGERNTVSVGSIEEKMGIHGNSTCVLNYDAARGWLLGDLHKGMRAMFTMMNEARLGVAMQGYACAAAAHQNAVAYARDRLQGRAIGAPANPQGPADPLIVHPDIRRSLMEQKSFVEGARALAFWCAQLLDRAHHGDAAAEGLISLLTPVAKGFLTDKGFDSAVQAQQVFGGHGYIEEHGMSQFVRDARIAMIYEGANGVQALDLVARKLPQDGGSHVVAFFSLIRDFCREHAETEMLATDFAQPLKAASKDLQSAATYFMERAAKAPQDALAGSYDFMHLFGHVALGYMWARMAAVARQALAAGTPDAAFYHAKLVTGRFYMQRQLPMTQALLARILSGADSVMALGPDEF